MMRTRTSGKTSNTDKKPIKVTILRFSACADVLKQLPEGVNDPNNWKICCDCCYNIVSGGKENKKEKNNYEQKIEVESPFK